MPPYVKRFSEDSAMLKFSLSLLLLFACGFLTISAQPVDPYLSRHKEKRAQNPEGLSFTVKLKDNRKQFHPGEIINRRLFFLTHPFMMGGLRGIPDLTDKPYLITEEFGGRVAGCECTVRIWQC